MEVNLIACFAGNDYSNTREIDEFRGPVIQAVVARPFESSLTTLRIFRPGSGQVVDRPTMLAEVLSVRFDMQVD